MLKVLFLWTCLFVTPFFASAQAADQKLIGKAEMYYFVWYVCDLNLYSGDGDFSFDKPFRLEIEYKRDISGEEIAESSAEKIRGLGFENEIKLAAWHAQMIDIFPDVNDGVSLTGQYVPNKPTIFYKNNEEVVGVIKDPDFGKWFFGIWLNENTSRPDLRKALLGKD